MSQTPNWSYARKRLFEDASENQDYDREEYPRLYRFHQDEFERYFDVYCSGWNDRTGEISAFKRGQVFVPTEQELEEFAKWYLGEDF